LSILLCKEEWLARASRINYWNTNKPECFVLTSITQQYKQKTTRKASLQSIQPLWKIWRITRELRALRINYWSIHKSVCFVLSYAVGYTANDSIKSTSAIHPAITEFVKCEPHISIHESIIAIMPRFQLC